VDLNGVGGWTEFSTFNLPYLQRLAPSVYVGKWVLCLQL